VAFSPDGKRIATYAGRNSGGRQEVKLWDSVTGAELMEMKSNAGPRGEGIEFNADGTRLTLGRRPGRTIGPVRGNDRSVVQTWDATPLPEK
jgi:hypothetical protein